MTTHQLTDEQRKLLEDCPRERLLEDMAERFTSVLVIEWTGSEPHKWTASWSRERIRGAYIPRAAVEAWMSEQDAKEAEIERRIGEAISLKSEVAYFNDWEATTEKFFVSEDFLFYRKEGAAPLTAIPVPRERIRAALDKHRAEQADHLRDATKMVHDDQSGDGTEMIEPRYPDEVGEGPWLVEKDSVKWSTGRYDEAGNYWDACVFYYHDSTPYPQSTKAPYSEPEARCLAEAERDRLNAIWRREEEARRRDIAHGEALEEEARRRGEEISDELRARLEKLFVLSVTNPFYCISLKESRHITSDGQSFPQKQSHSIYCTPAQARLFLEEKGIEVGT